MVNRSFVVSFFLVAAWLSPATAQQWAEKMFKTNYHNFGTVARGSKAEFSFEFENIYKEEVHIARVSSSCGCTTPSFAQSSVKTWEKAAIVTKYNTRSYLGNRGATITVVFDRPYYAEVQLTVTGHIRGDVVFDPGEVDFGSVEQSSAIEKLVKVSYAGRTNWRIVDVRSASEHLEVELTETGRSGGRVDYDMLIRLKPEAPAGLVQEQLTVVSDDSRNQTIPLIVVGRVSAALEVNPSSWFLGTLDPGQSATRKLVLRGKQPFKIVSVKCEDQRFEIDRAGGDEKKALHVIPVTFKAGNTPGQVNATIEIETDMGTGVATKCLTTGTIREPNGDAKSDSKGAAKNEP